MLAIVSSAAFSAGACTYQEAIMALENGNSVRGMALMQIAHRDGDIRASHYLTEHGYSFESSNDIAMKEDGASISLNQAGYE